MKSWIRARRDAGMEAHTVSADETKDRPKRRWYKRAAALSLGFGGGLVGLGAGVGCAFSTPRWAGPVSDHFDGRRFHNGAEAQQPHGAGGLLKWMSHREQGPWRESVDEPPGEPPPRKVDAPGVVRVTFVGHSTVLLQLDGLNILTDPIWSDRASPVPFAGPKRIRPPGVRFEDLPPIDVVLISHNHYDHLDLQTLRRLAERDRPRVVVPLGNKAVLDKAGLLGASELDWWQDLELAPGVRLVAVPAQHFSNRGPFDDGNGLWAGFVIESRSAGRVFFAGDSGYGPHFKEIAQRTGAPRLALLPIGAFRPRWFMGPVHMGPDQAVEAARDLGARTSVAIHFGTFKLADDGEEEPVKELQEALAKNPGVDFWVPEFGRGRDLPAR
ncbi:MAG TPA: MBL fold metallo-hydrolase [Myxococcales bacterium]